MSFSCECEPFKVDWLLKAFEDIPVFNDMMDLHKGQAFDERTKTSKRVPKAWESEECDVIYNWRYTHAHPDIPIQIHDSNPSFGSMFSSAKLRSHMNAVHSQQVNVVVDGYSCKSLSKQNNSAQSFLDQESKSGQGFKALLDYIDFAHPQVVVCENVSTMAHTRQSFGGEKPIAIQNQEMDRRGYTVFHDTVNSKDFGLRQCRTRVYSIYIKRHQVDANAFLECIIIYCNSVHFHLH